MFLCGFFCFNISLLLEQSANHFQAFKKEKNIHFSFRV